jgi:hypothetical protein
MSVTEVKLAPASVLANRAAKSFAERFDIDIPGNDATLDAPNLVKDLGRNEPQFRSG